MDLPLATSSSNTVVQAVADYGRQLFRFIRGKVKTDEEAEDILQDVWVQFALLPEVDELESASGWLYRVAKNKIVDSFRKKRPDRLPNEPEHLLDSLLSTEAGPEAEFFRKAMWEEIQAALADLPPNQAEVFVQNEIDGKTLQQIADDLGTPLKTIISRKGYAVKFLRNRLAYLYDELTD
jgi:RNA polymerase sigma factor (sigma-70 family)